jgi:Spy/CpxP family protein refolding chaperone
MTWLQSARSRYVAVGLVSAALGFLVALPVTGTAQDKKDPAPTAPLNQPADPNKELVEQVKLLQAKVARLEAAVAKIAPPAGGMGNMPGMGMGGMPGMGMGGMKGGGMPGMDNMMMGNMPGMGGMQGGGMPGMSGSGGGMMMDDMDMMGMGPMGGMKGMKMKMTAALPGFPGASHIYHIGATDFFLDHPEHITLTTDQKAKLNAIKQKAVADKATAQRKIDEAEQQLWELTAADQPDAAKIEAKVHEIEKLRGDMRMAFIRSVGEAAKVLTDDQRKSLLGHAPPAPEAPHVHPKTP